MLVPQPYKGGFPLKKRIIILSLCLAGALTVPALALTTSTAEVENAAPIAEDLTLKTYRGVAISSRFAAVDPEGDLVTFQVVDSPARGQVAVDENDPAAFTYTPMRGRRDGTPSPMWPSTPRGTCPSPLW